MKTIQAAIAAKADGYEYMTSVVKSVYQTTYYNINKIDDVISAGKWIPASKGQLPSGARGRIGSSSLPPKSINKSVAISKYCAKKGGNQ